MRNALGVALAKGGHPELAEEHFRYNLGMEPNDVNSQISLGRVLFEQEKYWEAIEEYEKVTDPGREKELLKENMQSAFLALYKKYYKRAKKDLDNPQVYFTLGVLYGKDGKHEEAVEKYKRAIRLNPAQRNAIF